MYYLSRYIIILILLCILSYAAGNISPATLMGRLNGVDIRKEGSGNPGTTNVLRTLGKKAAAITLVIDILKGYIPGLIGRILGAFLMGSVSLGMIASNNPSDFMCPLAVMMGTCAFLGHVYPLRYKFKGGKGIATGFGLLLAVDFKMALIALALAVGGALVSKRMSVGSILAGASIPVTATIFLGKQYFLWALVLAAIVIWRHRANIGRLLRGEEPPIGFLVRKK